ncbi:MAG: hypothetical protein KGQ50_00645 [Bacteroidetes bacterium]|nr:hypothetical protein [Bacteroidota bacterium]
MILITTSLLWILFFFILLDSFGANNVRKQAVSIAKTLYVDGPCLRLRVKGHLVSKTGRKTPLEGKIYINPGTKQYIFYADLTYQIIYAEKWLFTHNGRELYHFSSFRKIISGPFKIDFFPYLFSKKEINTPLLYKNEKEEGSVITWREMEYETIPRWISHSFSSLGIVNMEITLYAEESSFLWW